MLKKKYVVQKSVRLDEQLALDLETLSKILERPQNELLNIALENLMIENKYWFAQNIIVDFYSGFFENNEIAYQFEQQNLSVTLENSSDKKSYKLAMVKKNSEGKVIDKANFVCKSRDEVEQNLREFAKHLEFTPEIQNYLDHRLEYRKKSQMWSML